mgnify:CR=1 FL=1
MSELPRMYRCKIEKDINNNKRVYSSLYGDVYDSIIKKGTAVTGGGAYLTTSATGGFSSGKYNAKEDAKKKSPLLKITDIKLQ